MHITNGNRNIWYMVSWQVRAKIWFNYMNITWHTCMQIPFDTDTNKLRYCPTSTLSMSKTSTTWIYCHFDTHIVFCSHNSLICPLFVWILQYEVDPSNIPIEVNITSEGCWSGYNSTLMCWLAGLCGCQQHHEGSTSETSLDYQDVQNARVGATPIPCITRSSLRRAWGLADT